MCVYLYDLSYENRNLFFCQNFIWCELIFKICFFLSRFEIQADITDRPWSIHGSHMSIYNKKTLILRCSLIGWIGEWGLLIGLFKFKRMGTDEVNPEGPMLSIWASICRHYNNDKMIAYLFKMISSGKHDICLITNLIEIILIFKLADWQL